MNLDILSHTRPVQGKVVHAPCKRYMSEMATPGTQPTYHSAILISIWREEEGGRRRKHELSFDIILGHLGRELGLYSTNLTDVNIKLARWYR
jgi:hypothetical protein